MCLVPPPLKAATPPPGKGKGPPPGKGKGPPPGKGKAPPPGPKCGASGSTISGGNKEALSGPRLRPLFWTVSTRVPPDSVWNNLIEPAPFQKGQLEHQFALAAPRPKVSAQPAASEETRDPRKRLRILDDRTSQLLAIAFKKLPAPERLVTVVKTLDDFPESLPEEAVLALHAAVSEQKDAVEQLRQLKVQETDIAQLDMPERYLWVLGVVPACAAKLACGALIVGPGRELWDLRQASLKVTECCQALRSSAVVRKCISTSLAIGNFMNRGTPRSGANAVVLPESLLKFEELRSGQNVEDPTSENRGKSLLDFLAQSLVGESGARPQMELQAEVESIRVKARAAQTVSLEEAETTCRQVCAAAARARKGLVEIPFTSGASRLTEKVHCICEEADLVSDLLIGAKDALSSMQTWSSAQANVRGDDWFANWAQFLEQFSQAIARATPPPPPSRPALKELNSGSQNSGHARNAKRVNRAKVTFNEDERVENFDIASLLKAGMQQPAAALVPAPEAPLGETLTRRIR